MNSQIQSSLLNQHMTNCMSVHHNRAIRLLLLAGPKRKKNIYSLFMPHNPVFVPGYSHFYNHHCTLENQYSHLNLHHHYPDMGNHKMWWSDSEVEGKHLSWWRWLRHKQHQGLRLFNYTLIFWALPVCLTPLIVRLQQHI